VIARDMRAAGAARSVASADELRQAVLALWSDGPARAAMAQAAQVWRVANQGAVVRTLAVIRTTLASR
jgi:3-deoxy-D-manno-octulosonic-acid transferase